MQDHPADELDIEVSHLDGAPAGFADYGEGFGQDLVEGGTLGRFDVFGVSEALKLGGDARAEVGRLGPKLFIRQLFHLRLKGADLGNNGNQLFDDPLVGGAKYFRECLIEKHRRTPIFQYKCHE